MRTLTSLVEHLCDWFDADYIVDGLSPLDVGWTVEAPMRDRATALDHAWTEDTRRQYRGIPSIWS